MRGLLIIVALLGAAGVGVGAFAAHGMEKFLQEHGLEAAEVVKRLDQCDVAVRYHMFHTLALMVLAAVVAALFWMLGIALFSGGLYCIAIFGVKGHWTIVPSGGLCFIIGWCSLAGLAFQRSPDAA